MSQTVTKAQLIAAVAEEMGTDRKVAAQAFDAIVAVVTRKVVAGNTVPLPGLGRILTKDRPERQVRNPATGEMITKAADRQVRISVAKALKDSVNA